MPTDAGGPRVGRTEFAPLDVPIAATEFENKFVRRRATRRTIQSGSPTLSLSGREDIVVSITAYMSDDHLWCAILLNIAEEAVSEGEWLTAGGAYRAFERTMMLHQTREEYVLLPALERCPGLKPEIDALRAEHIQMRSLMSRISAALEEENHGRYLSLSESLLQLMQRHNIREEKVLYPLGDELLRKQRHQVISWMEAVRLQ